MGQQRVSNIALINTETAYANFVVNNNVIRILDIFGRRNGRDSYFFQRVYELLWAPMLVHHMTLISFRQFGQLATIFRQLVNPSGKKIARSFTFEVDRNGLNLIWKT